MTIRQLLAISTSAFFLFTWPCQAGPCSKDIDRMQARIDAKLAALAAAGPREKQTVGAQLHRQPTPQSIAEAESKVGKLSPGTIDRIESAMARARTADRAGDKSVCESALAEVQQTLDSGLY